MAAAFYFLVFLCVFGESQASTDLQIASCSTGSNDNSREWSSEANDCTTLYDNVWNIYYCPSANKACDGSCQNPDCDDDCVYSGLQGDGKTEKLWVKLTLASEQDVLRIGVRQVAGHDNNEISKLDIQTDVGTTHTFDLEGRTLGTEKCDWRASYWDDLELPAAERTTQVTITVKNSEDNGMIGEVKIYGATRQCPSPYWLEVGTKCYKLGSEGSGYAKQSNYADASALCANADNSYSYLSSFNSTSEFDAVYNWVTHVTRYSNQMWVGFKYTDADKYTWADQQSVTWNPMDELPVGDVVIGNNKCGQMDGNKKIKKCGCNNSDRTPICSFDTANPCLKDAQGDDVVSVCENGGSCASRGADGVPVCDCAPGYTGQFCGSIIDMCEGANCNFGTCVGLINAFVCRCDLGFVGVDCNSGSCENITCANGQCTTNVGAAAYCDCELGYTGTLCETMIDLCVGRDCNGGTCLPALNDWSCLCPDGFSGTLCETGICLNVTCEHGGTCVENLGAPASCDCVEGYEGDLCQTNIDDCTVNPCLNGGDCVDGVANFTCENCTEPYTGLTCNIYPCVTDIKVDENITCINNGYCEPGDGQDSYPACNCQGTGHEGDGCEIEVDECSSTPCFFGANCTDLFKDFECNCTDVCDDQTGLCYGGKQCNINECPSDYDACNMTSACIDGVLEKWSCNCTGTGYTGDYCEQEINECDTNPCKNNGVCLNLIGKYECNCTNTGYSGDHCDLPFNECESQPCQNNGYCDDQDNKYVCDCSGTGMTGINCEEGYDKCEPNPCLNGGTCANRDTDFVCECKQGFVGKYCEMAISTCMNALTGDSAANEIRQDSDFTASSCFQYDSDCSATDLTSVDASYQGSMRPSDARLNHGKAQAAKEKDFGCWSARKKTFVTGSFKYLTGEDAQQWIRVYLGSQKKQVMAIDTTDCENILHFTNKFKVKYADSGDTSFNDAEATFIANSNIKEYVGAKSTSQIYRNYFETPVKAHYVYVNPTSVYYAQGDQALGAELIGLRMELYGCDVPTLNPTCESNVWKFDRYRSWYLKKYTKDGSDFYMKDKTFENVATVDECQWLCVWETLFYCKSVMHSATDSICYLSKTSHVGASNTLDYYVQEDDDKLDYYERRCVNETEVGYCMPSWEYVPSGVCETEDTTKYVKSELNLISRCQTACEETTEFECRSINYNLAKYECFMYQNTRLTLTHKCFQSAIFEYYRKKTTCNKSVCPPGYEMVVDRCYKYTVTPLDYLQAAAECEADFAHLTSLETFEETYNVMNWLKKTIGSTGVGQMNVANVNYIKECTESSADGDADCTKLYDGQFGAGLLPNFCTSLTVAENYVSQADRTCGSVDRVIAVVASDLQHCADQCQQHDKCSSFLHSDVNCILLNGTTDCSADPSGTTLYTMKPGQCQPEACSQLCCGSSGWRPSTVSGPLWVKFEFIAIQQVQKIEILQTADPNQQPSAVTVKYNDDDDSTAEIQALQPLAQVDPCQSGNLTSGWWLTVNQGAACTQVEIVFSSLHGSALFVPEIRIWAEAVKGARTSLQRHNSSSQQWSWHGEHGTAGQEASFVPLGVSPSPLGHGTSGLLTSVTSQPVVDDDLSTPRPFICELGFQPHPATTSTLKHTFCYKSWQVLNNHCYLPVNKEETHSEAKKLCEKYNGHLVSAETINKETQIFTWMTDDLESATEVWLGMERVNSANCPSECINNNNIFTWDYPGIVFIDWKNMSYAHQESIGQSYYLVNPSTWDFPSTPNANEKRKFICQAPPMEVERSPFPDIEDAATAFTTTQAATDATSPASTKATVPKDPRMVHLTSPVVEETTTTAPSNTTVSSTTVATFIEGIDLTENQVKLTAGLALTFCCVTMIAFSLMVKRCLLPDRKYRRPWDEYTGTTQIN